MTRISSLAWIVALSLALAGCDRTGNRGEEKEAGEGALPDEAAEAGVKAAHFRHAGLHDGVDYFRDMDGAIPLTEAEVQGRAMWMIWTGGNDRFWDKMIEPTFGTFDLLKIVAGERDSGNERAQRWINLGIVNEPCFKAATGPDPERFGLWLDKRDPACGPDPFADENLYPGVAYKARGKEYAPGKKLPVGSYYGYPTGIVGLRLFPNPNFDAAAAAKWDPVKYYSDPTYYERKDIVRPYRVGMSCAFCHVGPSPTKPPANPNEPQWSELSSTVGAQYLWMDRIFYWNWKKKPESFLYQWLRTFKPGTMDTSLVSTDNINNPRTMNAIYDLPARLDMGHRIGRETLKGGALDNAQFNAVSQDPKLTRLFEKPDQVFTPRVLKDGSDSVGALGALNRVYLNIGLYSEEWMQHFNPVIGGKSITPIRIKDAVARSPYWQATNAGTPATALFFLNAGRPDRLADAPGGKALLASSPEQLAQGRRVFADTCARCHSSKGPQPPKEHSLVTVDGADYLAKFKSWWGWTQTDGFKQAMRAEVEKPDFLDNNYLSTEARIPVTLLRTNLCSPLATNALRGNIWDNFSSETYKTLSPVGWASYSDPFTGQRRKYRMPGGGRGYTRPPSLIALWSTAPYLLNNRLGPFDPKPAVANRVKTFDVAIRQLLWPERREKDAKFGAGVEGVIDRTDGPSWMYLPLDYMPGYFTKRALKAHFKDWVVDDAYLKLGPVPKGTPISALTNLSPRAPERDKVEEQGDADKGQLRSLIVMVKKLIGIFVNIKRSPPANDAALLARYEPLREDLRTLSKCRDFVVNRGHYFGTAQFVNRSGLTPDEAEFIGNERPLSDADKEALIAFLKTF